MGKRLVCGVGINDADYPVTIHEKINGKDTKVWRCKVYETWCDVLKRCYSPRVHAKQPSYAACFMCEEWLTFSNFKAWYEVNFVKGYHLDKDLVKEDNKEYSPETCIFVPPAVNSFLTLNGINRGEYPIGVHMVYKYNTEIPEYKAQGSSVIEKKYKYLGRFDTPLGAHRAWQEFKLEQAIYLQSLQEDNVANALQRVVDKLKYHLDNNIETKSL